MSTFQIPNATVVALQSPSPTVNAGMLSPTLQSAYYLANGQYVLGQPPIAVSGVGVGSSWVPGGTVFQGQIIVDSTGNQQIALNSGTSGSSAPTWLKTLLRTSQTTDGVMWRNVGVNYFSSPNSWIGLLNFDFRRIVHYGSATRAVYWRSGQRRLEPPLRSRRAATQSGLGALWQPPRPRLYFWTFLSGTFKR